MNTQKDIYQSVDYSLQHIFSYPYMRIMAILLVILIIQMIIRVSTDRIVERVVRSHKYTSKLEEHKREETLKKVFAAAAAILLWAIAIILILAQLKLNLSGLLASAGLISVVAGLSFQSIIKDYLAGMLVILENQYRIGDDITLATPVATVSGVVEDISIRMTKLRDLDGNLHLVTNGSVGVISNKSFQFSNVNLDIVVSYDADIELVEKLINEAGAKVAADERFKESIIEPVHFLRIEALNESNITVKAFGKVRPGSQWDIGGDMRRHLKALFVKHHIAVPYENIEVRAVKK